MNHDFDNPLEGSHKPEIFMQILKTVKFKTGRESDWCEILMGTLFHSF